jgi:hypothetical protein
MKYRVMTAAFIALCLLVPVAHANGGTGQDSILGTLRQGHPRLVVLDSDVPRVKKLIRTDAGARALYGRIAEEAEEILAGPLTDYEAVDYRDNIVSTKVMLGKVRICVRRVYTLLTVYRLDGDEKYMERAKQEIMRAAGLPDWNPIHFLDTAEMTHAVAIGYDWMYHDLTEDERRVLREAIVEKGLTPALKAYRRGWLSGYGFWTVANHNWNQVCNGGIVLGALAIADEEPELAEKILEHARESIKIAMAEFAPDGAWAEGPSYWSYATEYNVYLIAGLKTALGTDLGLSKMPGFSQTGMFRIHYVGPLGLTFNYADAPDRRTDADDQMFWMAREFNEPLYAWHAKKFLDTTKAPGLWWYDPRGEPPADLPRDAFFRGADVAFFRSAWDDPEAVFVGLKGGDNKANHSHLDLGTFVLDALGVRWAVDLGRDSYKLPLYFDTYLGNRWKYYRLRTEGHNTLTLDNKNQKTRAKAPIIAFESNPDYAFAVADLTAAYQPAVKSALRGVAMVDRSRVIVQDEIEARKPVQVVWGFLTRAEIKTQGQTAVLAQNHANLAVRIVEPADAYFEVVSASQAPPQDPNQGVANLTIQLPQKVKTTRIAVELIPLPGQSTPPPPRPVVPLCEW